MRARREATRRSASRSADCSSATRASASRNAATVRSWCSSRPISPWSNSPARACTVSNSARVCCARAAACSMRSERRATLSSIDSTRARIVSTRPARRASPSRRSASARTAARWARSASAASRSRSASSARAASSRPRASASSASSLCSAASTSWASASSASGFLGSLSPVATGSTSRCWARSLAMRTVAADAFGQRGQPEPGVLDRLGPHGELGQRGLVGGQFLGRHRQAGGGLVVLAAHGRLGLQDRVALHLPIDQVVGGQPQPGVAQVGLDGLGATGDLGLAAQRLELAAQLGGQVGEPGEVRRHGFELAQRLFLALAVLEHAGGFLDERAAILGPRLQDLVELALPHDDVHLAADAGVAQQLLDIHQTATAAVDFVFAGPVAEHPAGDRHLGVLDRQRVIGVVDGDGHLGAAQRCPRRGAGEDDVFHLSAAQRLCALLPHHPGQGVDDVGFSRAVGADDGGDARLETQSRRRGEGLEALQRQTLQVHGQPDYRSD